MDGVLEQLAKLDVQPSSVIKHAATATLQEQVNTLSGHAGAVTKNLFFKDARQRYFLCTCLGDTKIDHVKVLPIRLGLAKKEFKFADPSELQSVLAVPPGSATPLAVCQPLAARVVLLLDQRLKTTPFFVHPMDNTASVLLTHQQLEAYLASHGRQAHYVDFSIGIDSELKFGADKPPDLRALADTVQPLKDKAEPQGMPAGTNPAAAKAGAASAKSASKQPPAPTASKPAPQLDSVPECMNAIIGKVLSAVGLETDKLTGEQLRRLKLDVEVELNSFRNASYARGMNAAKGAMLASITREWQ